MAGSFAHGAIVKLNTTTISEVTSITAPNFTADTLDVTTHSSPDAYREYIQGLRDGGEIAVEGNYTTGSAAAILLQFNTSSTVTMTVDLPTKPSATRFTATVICTEFSSDAPFDGIITFSSNFKVTGKPTVSVI
jgi:predicted secreted protein